MLQFEFMRRTLLVSLMLSIMIPLIGIVMVNRKTSMVGDALSHVSLAGVGVGLILGIDIMIGTITVCVIGAFSIESIRKKFPQYGDMATAVTLSIGLGVAAILSDFAPGGNAFESYLFGSISSVRPSDVMVVSLIFVLVGLGSIIFYGGLLDIAVDTNLARLAGVNIKLVNTVFTLFSAITIALACKIVGALLVTSLIVLPVATSLIVSKSYKQTFIISVVLGVVYMMLGISISFYYDVKPGGAIVLNALMGMLLFSIYSRFRKSKRKKAIYMQKVNAVE